MKSLVRTFLLGIVGLTAMAATGDQVAPSPTPPASASPSPPAADIEDFVPSEKVGADDAVAFPVDI